MTRDDIIRMMRDAGFTRTKYAPSFHKLCEIAAIVEREKCAELCDGIAGAAQMNAAVLPESKHRMVAADDCAALIRARNNNE